IMVWDSSDRTDPKTGTGWQSINGDVHTRPFSGGSCPQTQRCTGTISMAS
ncbi:unnamed protein product, partial [Nesidiocoris tenuis]